MHFLKKNLKALIYAWRPSDYKALHELVKSKLDDVFF